MTPSIGWFDSLFGSTNNVTVTLQERARNLTVLEMGKSMGLLLLEVAPHSSLVVWSTPLLTSSYIISSSVLYVRMVGVYPLCRSEEDQKQLSLL